VSDAAEIEVLIPHFNRASSLGRTLDSLRGQTLPAATCVVDNGSTDGTGSMLAADYPEVRVVRLGRNLGFGAALNRGVGTSSARVVVFLNNDAVADPRFLERLAARQAETAAEMVAACLRAPDGSVESLGVEVDSWLNAYDARHGKPFEAALSEAAPLGPTGGAGAYLREAFERVGGFDETLFAYLEDVDLAIRMRIAGLRCAVAADAFVWHRHSATLGARSSRKNELLGFGRGYLLWKFGRNLSLSERFAASLGDCVVYTGKAVLDRNLGAVRGRLRARRLLRGRPRPAPDPGLAELPLLRLSLREALRRRLARRR
jgi:N-acetylglucosaminyl-diphospho-decaprenol L-rhamnosyltransferase